MLGFSVCSIWYGAWYPEAQVSMLLRTGELLGVPYDFWDVSREHLVNWKSPVPFTGLTLMLGVVGGVGGFISAYKLNKLQGVDLKLRSELDAHSDTKENYYQSLKRQLYYGFADLLDETSRVSIYSFDSVNDRLRMLYRHAKVDEWREPGRISFKASEGVAGAVLKNGNYVEIDELPLFKSPRYIKSLRTTLEPYRVNISEDTLSKLRMPSRCYLATAIRDFESDVKIAVVVFESTKVQNFNRSKILAEVNDESLKLPLVVRHLTILDRELNPFGGQDE